jgi:hypothetical protein
MKKPQGHTKQSFFSLLQVNSRRGTRLEAQQICDAKEVAVRLSLHTLEETRCLCAGQGGCLQVLLVKLPLVNHLFNRVAAQQSGIVQKQCVRLS